LDYSFLTKIVADQIETTISDLVQIPPVEFYKRSLHAVEDKINEKYSNKVLLPLLEYSVEIFLSNCQKIVQKVGLCVCLYDLLKVSDGLIGHGSGNVNVNGRTVWHIS
jgi:DNA-directed RNA polymerase III subunit RPC8